MTLVELIVVLAVLSVVGAMTLPLVSGGQQRVSALRAAQRFATAVRMAQAVAQDMDCRTRVVLLGDDSFVVERSIPGGWRCEARGSLRPVSGRTSYPQDRVEFTQSGLPLVGGTDRPRAGTFRFSCGGKERSVVLQLTGRVRVR